MAATDDFFGASYIDADPFAAGRADARSAISDFQSTFGTNQPAPPQPGPTPPNPSGSSSPLSMPQGIDPRLAQLYQQSGLQPADRGSGFADWQYWQDKANSNGWDYILGRLGSDLSGTGSDQATGTPSQGIWDNSGSQPAPYNPYPTGYNPGGYAGYTTPGVYGGAYNPYNVTNAFAAGSRQFSMGNPSGPQTGFGSGTTAYSPYNPYYPPANNPQSYYPSSGAYSDANVTNIPPDLQGLRSVLSNYFTQNVGDVPPSYPGSFNIGDTSGMSALFGMAQNNPQMIASLLSGGQGGIAQLLGGANTGGFNSLTSGAIQSAGGYSSLATPSALSIAQTGGAPTQQLLAALAAIQNSGQTNINSNLAQIREQYGAQGTGVGSDVNNALALGATTGQQNIESQQSSLLAQVLQNAASTQLGGVNALAGLGGLNVNAYNTGGNIYGQGQSLNLNSILGGVNALPNYASALNSSNASSLQALGVLGGLQSNNAQFGITNDYNNFVRMTSPSPFLTLGTQYGSTFPGVQQPIPSAGTTLGAAGIAAGGSILGALLPYLMLG